MATLKEKLTALQMILGDDALTEQVIKRSLATEKAADDAGLEFKEKDGEGGGEVDKTKAKGKKNPPPFMKKKPAPAASDAETEEEVEEEVEEDVEEEEEKESDADVEEETYADADAEGDDLDDDDEFDDEEGKEFTEFVGDLPVDALAEMIATTWKEAFTPLAALLQLSVDIMKEMTVATKEMRDPAAMKAVTKRIDEIEGTLKSITGDMPKAAKKSLRNGYRATEDEDTVVEGGEEAVKEVGPGKADSGFLNFLGVK